MSEAAANETRGEVDIEFEGQGRFVLRPSYEAMQKAEKETGKTAVELYRAAAGGALSNRDAAIVTAEFIRAWGKASDNAVARGVSTERIGELIYEAGLMNVLGRLAIVLGWAIVGGCKADGSLKGEATATGTMTTAAPVAG